MNRNSLYTHDHGNLGDTLHLKRQAERKKHHIWLTVFFFCNDSTYPHVYIYIYTNLDRYVCIYMYIYIYSYITLHLYIHQLYAHEISPDLSWFNPPFSCWSGNKKISPWTGYDGINSTILPPVYSLYNGQWESHLEGQYSPRTNHHGGSYGAREVW